MTVVANAQRKMQSTVELIAVVVVFAAIWGLGRWLGLPYKGSLAVVASVLTASVMLRRRGQAWRDLGLRGPRSFSSFGLGVLVTILLVATVAIVATFLASFVERLAGPQAESAPFSQIQNLREYVTVMVIAWTAAAVGEELLFRGFIFNRLAESFGSSRVAWVLALVVQSTLFGLCHYTQGAFGIVMTGIVGLLFGLFYLAARNNLLPLIFAHGIVDTVSLSQTFFGGS